MGTKLGRPSIIKPLITEGLGYCCPWLFLKLYPQTAQVADRLGVDGRTVRLLRASPIECEGKEDCMKRLIKSRA